MSEVVSHAGDVAPGVRGLLLEDVWVDVLDRFADLDEPHAHRVEHKAVLEPATLEVQCDGLGGGDATRLLDANP